MVIAIHIVLSNVSYSCVQATESTLVMTMITVAENKKHARYLHGSWLDLVNIQLYQAEP